MTSYFDPEQGFFVRTPSWHGLESAVLGDWPGTWEQARTIAKLDWEPVPQTVYSEVWHESHSPDGSGDVWETYEPIPGYQLIERSDTHQVLAIQSDSYRVINNTEFGAVIESVMGLDLGEELAYEGVFTLHGGRKVMAVTYFKDGLQVQGDPSKTVRYAVFASSHDGTGGLRCILTNVRVVCANTLAAAEAGAQSGVTGFSIRHTARWDERVAEVREQMLLARQGAQGYIDLMNKLNGTGVSVRARNTFVKRMLPIGDDMGKVQRDNRLLERDALHRVLEGPTCEHIANTAYGLLMACTEWEDHVRKHRTQESYVNRQLKDTTPFKDKALRLATALVPV